MAAAPVPRRSIRTRRIAFDYPEQGLRRHYVSGDPAMSHVVAVLSAVFPEGEDFFVRSVRAHRDRIDDPELRRQVAAFIGQESVHGREHRSFNRRLQAMGYPTWLIDRCTKYGLAIGTSLLPRSHQLAMTAALEHYTATLAETLLRDGAARDLLDVDEVRSLFLWHALEEAEHKSVAFDVFEAVHGRYVVRAGVMHAVTAGFAAGVLAATTFSLLLDPHTYRHPRRTARSVRRLRRSPWLGPDVVARIRDYNRRGFHPEDHDADELVEAWRAELFGPVTPRLRSG
jgi:predicted metal-dependent hydrolase